MIDNVACTAAESRERGKSLSITIRPCTDADLRALEWDGMYTGHREIIERAFERQLEGTNVMLVAELDGDVVGQVWIDLQLAVEGAALLWELRVHPVVQRCGIGTGLLNAAERWLFTHGIRTVAIGVERANKRARRLYEREGYRLQGAIVETYAYTTPDGIRRQHTIEEWLLEKTLLAIESTQ